MKTTESFAPQIYQLNGETFEDIALRIFQYQAENNPVYTQYILNLKIDPRKIRVVTDIPFLPISLFKTFEVKTGNWKAEAIFQSSGTTSQKPSCHSIADLEFYRSNCERCFEHFFGPLKQFHFLALLPSYLERPNSSLVVMMDHFIKSSDSPYSRFYLNEVEELVSVLEHLEQKSGIPVLFGVSFALLDLAEKQRLSTGKCLVFETGGMKGRRKEMVKAEMSDIIRKGLGVSRLYSEYGMAELMSQAYSTGADNKMLFPPWARVLIRDLSDPFDVRNEGSGGLNIIDLANWRTISFIETEDLGKVFANHSFEITGRLDNSEVRGCNLMIS